MSTEWMTDIEMCRKVETDDCASGLERELARRLRRVATLLANRGTEGVVTTKFTDGTQRVDQRWP
jgi:hypothetical protein